MKKSLLTILCTLLSMFAWAQGTTGGDQPYSLTVTSQGGGLTSWVEYYDQGGYIEITSTKGECRDELKTWTIESPYVNAILFTPDDGCSLSKVTLNGTDITSSLVTYGYRYYYPLNNISETSEMEVIYTNAVTPQRIMIMSYGNDEMSGAIYGRTYCEMSGDATGKGPFDGAFDFEVAQGTDVPVQFSPEPNCRIDSVILHILGDTNEQILNVTDQIVNNAYVIQNVSAPTSMYVYYGSVANYSLNVSVNGFGGRLSTPWAEVTPDNSPFIQEVQSGENVEIAILPEAGYQLNVLLVNNEDKTADVTLDATDGVQKYTFVMNEPTEIFATFASTTPQPYARLSEDQSGSPVLTFYYNMDYDETDPADFGMNADGTGITWTNVAGNVTKVVFDESFAQCTTIMSTASWFSRFGNMMSIDGLQYLNTTNVTDMTSMFSGCYSLMDLDLSGFNTVKVIGMDQMFSAIGLTILDLSSFNTANVEEMSYMFNGCNALTKIYVGEEWSTSKVSSSDGMFRNCTSLVGGAGTPYDAAHVDASYAHIDGGENNPGYFTDINAPASYNIKVKVVGNGEVMAGQTTIMGGNEQEITATPGEALQMYFFPAEGWSLSSLKVANTDVTSEVTPNPDTGTLGYLLTVNDTSSVVVTFAEKVATPIRTAVIGDTLVYSTSTEGAKIEYILRLTSEGTVEEWGSSDSPTLKLVLQQNLYVEVFAAKEGMITSDTLKFYYPYTAWHSLEAAISSATELAQEASGNPGVNPEDLESLRSQISLSQAMYDERVAEETDITSMTTALSNICETVSREMTSEPEAYAVLSENNTILTFYYDTNKSAYRETYGVGPFDNDETGRGWHEMRTQITKVSFDSSFANFTTLTSLAWWFSGMSNLVTIEGLANLKTSNVTDMWGMFEKCSSLSSLDLSTFDTRNVEKMAYMLDGCTSLQSLNISSFITSNVKEMGAMFQDCSSLPSLDVTGFDVQNNRSLWGTFAGLTVSTLDISSFNTALVDDMGYMFARNPNLTTIYVGSGWTTANVAASDVTGSVGGYDMFAGCTSLVGGLGTPYDANHVDETYAHIDGGASNPGYFTDINAPASYNIKVKVVGNGEVMAGQTTIMGGDEQEIIATPGEALQMYFFPAEGWSLSSLKVANTDVTSEVTPNPDTGTLGYLLTVNDTSSVVVTFAEKVATPIRTAVIGDTLVYSTSTEGAKIEYILRLTSEGTVEEWGSSDSPTLKLVLQQNLYVEVFAAKEGMITSDTLKFYYPYTAWHSLEAAISSATELAQEASGNPGVNPEDLESLRSQISLSQAMYDERVAEETDITSMTTALSNICETVSREMTSEPEAYAVLTDNQDIISQDATGVTYGKTLTFFYDTNKSSHSGAMSIEQFTSQSERGWSADASSITAVVFNNSFADYLPTSTGFWFYGCSLLASIEGLSNLRTNNVESMTSMFEGCNSLSTIDLRNFNTDRLVDVVSMFQGCSSLTTLDVSNFDTSRLLGMNNMFAGCSSLTTLDLSHFSTDNLTDMNSMFYGCSSLTSLDLSNFNTTKVRVMDDLFFGCTNLATIYVGSEWSTANVETSDAMFYGCTNLKGGAGTPYDVDHVDASYAHIDGGENNPGYFTDRNASYNEAYGVLVSENNSVSLTLYYDGYKSSHSEGLAIGLDEMMTNQQFLGNREYIQVVTIDSTFVHCELTTTAGMFSEFSSLTAINDLKYLKTDKVTNMWRMFYECPMLTSLDVSGFNTANVTNMEAMFEGCSSLTSLDVSGFNTTNVTTMQRMFMGCRALETIDVSRFNTEKVTDMESMFESCGALRSINVSHFNTDNVANMGNMFVNCSGLTSLDVTNFNTVNVTNLFGTFSGCTGLTVLDLSSFNTAKVTDMGKTFLNCSSLTTIYAGSEWTTASVTEGNDPFGQCTSLVGGAGTPYDANHVDYTYARIDGGPNSTTPGYFTDKNAPITIAAPEFRFEGDNLTMTTETQDAGIFYKIADLPSMDEAVVDSVVNSLIVTADGQSTYYDQPFELKKAAVVKAIAVIRNETGTFASDTTTMVYDYEAWVNLKAAVENGADLYGRAQGNPDVDTQSLEQLQRALNEGDTLYNDRAQTDSYEATNFTQRINELCAQIEAQMAEDEPYAVLSDNNTKLTFFYDKQKSERGGMSVGPFTERRQQGWYSERNTITNVVFDESFANCTSLTSTAYWFADMVNLTTITDISNLNTDNVTDMYGMFMFCRNLTSLDVNGFNTSNVTNMESMFYECSSLTSLDVSKFNTSKVTNMMAMFQFCSGLTVLDVSKFDMSNVTDLTQMFCECSGLTSLKLGAFNIEKVTDIQGLFYGLSSMRELDLSSINTSNIEGMAMLFQNCTSLTTLNLSNFNTANVANMLQMFFGCTNLKTIYVGDEWTTSQVTNSERMFDGCTALIGGAGTHYDANYVDASYAHIDGGSANPGYFTRNGDSPWVDPVIVAAPEFRFEGDNLTMTTETQNAGIFYKVADLPSMAEAVVDSVVNSLVVTADGQSTYYDQPFELKKAAVVKAIAVIRNETGTFASDTTTMVYDYEAWVNLKAAVSSGADLYGRAQGNPNVDTQLLEQLQWALNEGDMIYNDRAQTDSFEATHFTQRINELCAQIEAQMAEDEPYAVLSDNNTKLTFFYDKQKSERGGMSVGPFTERRQQGWYSERNTITNVVFDESFANCTSLTSTAYWFADMVNLTTITDISNLNTDNVTDMYGMFMFCRNLTSLDVNGFNTSNVTNMESMFYECSSLTSLDVSKFNTSKVTNMMAMFQFCSGLTVLDVSKFDMSNVTDLTQMFCECSGLTSLKLGAFNIEKVTDIQGLFYGLSSMRELDLSSINTSNIEGMAMLFQNCTSLTTLNLSNFNTANVANMLQMFFGCTNLKTIYVGDEWTTSQVTNSERMFDGCTALIGGAGTHYDANYVDASYAHIDGGSANPGYFTRNGDSPWVDPVIVAAPEFRFEGDNLTMTTETQNAGIFYKVADLPSMAEAVVDSVVNSLVVTADGQSTYYDQPFELKKAAVVKAIAVIRNETGTFASDTTTMVYDYEAWVNLKAAVESGADLYGRAQGNPNVDTQLLEQLQWALNEGDMIYNQRAQMDSFEAKHFTQRINELCAQIEAQMAEDEPYAVLSDNNTKLTFFYDKKKAANNGMSVGPFAADDDVPWFNQRGNITTVEFDPSFANCTSITRTAYWFYGCKNIVSISGIEYLKTDNVTSMYAMFYECSGLSSLDVSHLITDNVMDMTVMFDGCSKLTTLDVSHFNTANVTSMGYMFYKCSSLTSLDVSHFNTEKVTNMASMFHGCSGLTSLDVSHFNTANVTRIDFMFYSCSGLATLDVSHFNTANVTDMSNLFYDCYRLTSLDVRGFNTANVTDMNWMFTNCSKLTSLDVSHFNTEKVTNMNGMFYGCSGLTSLDVSGFNTANVTGMGSMFSRCSNLTNLDVSGFNTENVTRMASMFEGCSNLTSLDVSHFNTANVTDLRWMFRDCSGLKTIYAGSGWTTAAVTSGNYMFTDCTSLIGGAGTPYDANHTDYTYAHIDGGESNPGYFTDKNAPEGEATFDGLVARVSGERTLDEAFEQRGGRAEAAKTIAAIVWNKETALTDTDLQGITNPNLLIYVKGDSLAPTNRNNIIVDGFAKNIVLTDLVQGNNNFYCPQDFTAEAISYTHEFKQQTQVGVSRGWETIALPFTVQTIMHEKRGVITPFGNSSSNTHFWLRRLTSNGLQAVPMIEANTAYLISMPNSEEYSADFNLAGRVTFSAENAVVPMTEIVKDESADYIMTPVFENTAAKQGVYVLNVGEERNGYPEGSIFESNYRAVLPFQAYTEHKGSNPAPAYIIVGDLGGDTTGIDAMLVNSERVNGEAWHTLDGRKLQGKPTQKGVYILNGKKVIIK